jgi:hypothetical protein
MTFLRLGDGTIVHVRMSKPRRRKCSVCGIVPPASQLRECDFKVGDGKTCDRLMCQGCANRIGPDEDLCPDHYRLPHSLAETP